MGGAQLVNSGLGVSHAVAVRDGWSCNGVGLEQLGAGQAPLFLCVVSGPFHVASLRGLIWTSSQHGGLRAVDCWRGGVNGDQGYRE